VSGGEQAPDRPDLYAAIRRDHKWRGRAERRVGARLLEFCAPLAIPAMAEQSGGEAVCLCVGSVAATTDASWPSFPVAASAATSDRQADELGRRLRRRRGQAGHDQCHRLGGFVAGAALGDHKRADCLDRPSRP
jgi:hypothetical protein